MADLTEDTWIASNSPLSPQRLHAIGVISFRWNECEFWKFHLFREISGLPRIEAWALAHDISDELLTTRIRMLMMRRDYHKDGIALIDNALAHYDCCRKNRNSVIHAWTRGRQDGEAILARKSKRPDSMDTEAFPAGLTVLRRVAEEIEELMTRLWVLNCVLEEGSMGKPITLLEKLRLPSLLWTPPPPPNTKPPRPPRPSSASRRKAAMKR